MQSRMLIPLVNIDLDFSLSSNAFSLRSNSTVHQYQIKLDKFVIKLSRCRVNPSVAAKIEERMTKSPCLYPLRLTKARIITIPPGAKHYETELFGPAATVIPPTLILGLTTTKASQGTQNLCALRFNHHDILSLTLNVAGESRPSPNGYQNLCWSGKNSNYLQCYYDLFDQTVKINEGNSINLSEYAENFCFFKINLGYLYNQAHDHIEHKKISTCRLILTFAPDSDNESLSLVVYSENDGMLAINNAREVIRDFIL